MTRLSTLTTTLALCVALLALLLLWRKCGETRHSSDLPQDRDLFNMQGYEDRKKDFESEINREERLGRK